MFQNTCHRFYVTVNLLKVRLTFITLLKVLHEKEVAGTSASSIIVQLTRICETIKKKVNIKTGFQSSQSLKCVSEYP